MSSWIENALNYLDAHPAWAFIGAIAIVTICFVNSVQNDFILDDYAIVATNPAIRTINPVQNLTTPYWGKRSTAGIYRPLTILSFSFEYPLWHRWPGGYRLTNLLIHAINGFLVFILARRLLQSLGGALLAGAIYLVHPVHTEPVVGLVGRSELLAAMFFLLAWLLFRQRRTGLCIVAFFLSLLSKENAIAFPAVIASMPGYQRESLTLSCSSGADSPLSLSPAWDIWHCGSQFCIESVSPILRSTVTDT